MVSLRVLISVQRILQLLFVLSLLDQLHHRCNHVLLQCRGWRNAQCSHLLILFFWLQDLLRIEVLFYEEFQLLLGPITANSAVGQANERSDPTDFESMTTYAPPYAFRVMTCMRGTVASQYAYKALPRVG